MKRALAILIALFLLSGCGGSPTNEVKGDNTGGESSQTADSSDAGGEATQEAPDQADGITAEFKVTTTGKASVTWGTGSGMSQDEIKKGSWKKKVALDDFDVATLTVTSSDFMKSQKVTCQILINGVSKSKNSAKGKVAMANCSTNTTE